MENLLYYLKSDFELMLNLTSEIAMYQEKMLHHIDMCDKRNFKPELADNIKIKISEKQNILYNLKNKWGLK